MGFSWYALGQLADSLAIPGFALGAWGLWATYRQARDARTAAEAARDAASQAQAAISRSNLLVAVKDLQSAEEDILDAFSRQSAAEVSRTCRTWRANAGSVRGLLDAAGLDTRTLSSMIQDSVALAAQVERKVRAVGSGDVLDVEDLLTVTAKVTHELGFLTSRESHRPGGKQ
ncbi:hypothetical protein [Micromonospora chalcea]|uniref:hypothetical protein n=1 Tax=Micromonospora chalcea TaxID=1874 RepID=UPI0033F05088